MACEACTVMNGRGDTGGQYWPSPLFSAVITYYEMDVKGMSGKGQAMEITGIDLELIDECACMAA
jgi:hypothetical protein